jgi:hypothetical protein
MPQRILLLAALLALARPATAQEFGAWFFTAGFIGRVTIATTGNVADMPGAEYGDRRALVMLRCAQPMRDGATDTIGFTPPGQVMLVLSKDMVGSDGPSDRTDIDLRVDGAAVPLGPFRRAVDGEGTPHAEVLFVQQISLEHPLLGALRGGRELAVAADGGQPMRVSLEDADRQVGRLPGACARIAPRP